MLAVHFGAGNIGRGFIGHLLADSGYEVVFADINDDLISQLQQADSYRVHYAEAEGRSYEVTRFKAVHSAAEKKALVNYLETAEIVTTAVGAHVLPHVAPVIAESLKKRLGSSRPVTVIACENAVNGTDMLTDALQKHLTGAEWEKIQTFASFPNAAVDRIVPVQNMDNPLDVLVEPFFEWTIENTAGSLPPIEGAHYVDNLGAYIERKLFTVNTGHAAAAYHGYQKGYTTVQEALKDTQILKELQETLSETGALLKKKYGFDEKEHAEYIVTIISRFANEYLTDQITRVARQPMKKLGPAERLVSPALQLIDYGTTPEALLRVIRAAMLYDFAEDEEAVSLQESIRKDGPVKALASVTGLPEDHQLIQKAVGTSA
ncbi:mannitol-1-phosphate 5-dehydrogenase [Alkalicoccus halolimnae]|uniref:Mannitol-1-phosphate 5-dehydrogenase n=1 Tax=Alkalicoccus halolimnae TaxID=1667239 RepID=A0A5C7F3Q8_9BACI|nr:mannitol-1-phosphate 5-dehydrogenase [Alkalicoccus halolimnae]TXF85262.1 mannitol-1-phosphate 5-dehydrogenase [Alkalicoccus halolimnae]